MAVKVTKTAEPAERRIRIQRGCVIGPGATASAGDIVTLPAAKARYLCAIGKAEPHEPKPKPTPA
jgi:hypothetical protein